MTPSVHRQLYSAVHASKVQIHAESEAAVTSKWGMCGSSSPLHTAMAPPNSCCLLLQL